MSDFTVRKMQLARASKSRNSRELNFKFFRTTNSQIILVMASLMIMFVFLSVMYLMHYNQVVSRGYVLRDLENEKQDLLLDFEKSDSTLAKYESLSYVRESDVLDRMVRANNIIYAKDSGNNFAMNLQ